MDGSLIPGITALKKRIAMAVKLTTYTRMNMSLILLILPCLSRFSAGESHVHIEYTRILIKIVKHYTYMSKMKRKRNTRITTDMILSSICSHRVMRWSVSNCTVQDTVLTKPFCIFVCLLKKAKKYIAILVLVRGSIYTERSL